MHARFGRKHHRFKLLYNSTNVFRAWHRKLHIIPMQNTILWKFSCRTFRPIIPSYRHVGESKTSALISGMRRLCSVPLTPCERLRNLRSRSPAKPKFSNRLFELHVWKTNSFGSVKSPRQKRKKKENFWENCEEAPIVCTIRMFSSKPSVSHSARSPTLTRQLEWGSS